MNPKTILTLFLIVFCLFRAQAQELKWGTPQKAGSFLYPSIAGHVGDEVILITQKGMLQKKYIEKYKVSSGDLVFSKEIIPPIGEDKTVAGKKLKQIGIFHTSEKVIMVMYYADGRNAQLYYYAHDVATGVPQDAPVVLKKFNTSSLYSYWDHNTDGDNSEYYLAESSNNKYKLLVHNSTLQNRGAMFKECEYWVFDEAFHLIKNFKDEWYTEWNCGFTNFNITNNGDIFTFTYKGTTKTIRVSTNNGSIITILPTVDQKILDKIISYKANFDYKKQSIDFATTIGKIAYDADIKLNCQQSDKIKIIGFCSGELKEDNEKNTFDELFITDFNLTENILSNTQYLKKDQLGKINLENGALNNFENYSLHTTENGASILVAESFYHKYRFNYNNILVIAFNNTNKITWGDCIYKRQIFKEKNGMGNDFKYWLPFYSFQTIFENNTLNVLYNDNPKNQTTGNKSDPEKIEEDSKSSLVCVSYNIEKGLLDSKILYNAKGSEIAFMPGITQKYKYENNHLYPVIGKRKKKICIGAITIK